MEKEKVIENKIVSVIIPVYQAEKYLLRCVESVINQSYEHLEIILIDDGSKDNSLAICYELEKKDIRIRVFHHENIGVAATRNKGLEYASGQYVYFLDSDDWIDENTLLDMVTSLEENDADICICGFKYIEDYSEKEHCFSTSCYMDKKVFMEKCFWELYDDAILFNIGTKLYKRSIIEENNIRFSSDMIIYEDIKFCLDYIDKVQYLFLCGKPHYYYFSNNNCSITHVYKSEFWRSTAEYCNLLINRFSNYSVSLRKAVLLCLYRAYLQECHNPKLRKKDLCQRLNKICFPLVEKLNLKNSQISELSMDQRIFMFLISWKLTLFLWGVAVLVSKKNYKK